MTADKVAQNQDQLRSDLYQGVADAVDAADTAIGRSLGKKVLPSSFYGGPRSVAQRYQVIVTLGQFGTNRYLQSCAARLHALS